MAQQSTLMGFVHRRRRGAELFLLVLSLLVGIGAYVAVGLGVNQEVPANLFAYGGWLAALLIGSHIVIRIVAPYADPVLLPVVGALNGLGLAVIHRLDLAAEAEGGTHDFAQQQLIWMTLGVPAIDEVGAADPTGGPVGSETEVGDPAGDGAFVPSANNGRVQVIVDGSFPQPLAPGGRFTLPADGATLASALATDADPSVEDASMRWDIHDDMTKAEGHVAGFCTTDHDPVGQCRGHAARSRSRRCRWVVRVRSRGRSVHQASRRIRLTAAAARACSRRVLASPV